MNAKIKLVPTTQTHLMCIACGRFLTRKERGKHWAIVPPGVDDENAAVAGLHRECKDGMAVRRKTKSPKEAA